MSISALFVREDSVYKSLGLDCWDINRNAINYQGHNKIIAHPPCRAWGRLRSFARPRPGEKELALFAIDKVRSNGGVLEHPHGSTLFPTYLPLPGSTDAYGGYTISINQSWFGHKAQKKTFIYIVGCPKSLLPPIPISFDCVEYVVCSSRKDRPNYIPKKEITKAEREHTPLRLAEWLISVCSKML